MNRDLFPSGEVNKPLTKCTPNGRHISPAGLIKKSAALIRNKIVFKSHSTTSTGSVEDQTSPIAM